MKVLHMPSYRADDLPACLASVGLLKVLTRYANVNASAYWEDMHLVLCHDAVDIWLLIQTVAMASTASPHWDLLDACDDPSAWDAAAKNAVCRPDVRDVGDFLMGAGAYLNSSGGRSPLICTSRNVTPGRWAKKNVALAAKGDWSTHCLQWQGDSSWQGWRPSGDKSGDPIAIWLALEGLSCFPCVVSRESAREIGRRDVVCPGWDKQTKAWSFPIWEHRLSLNSIKSLTKSLLHAPRKARFTRRAKKVGGYFINEFGSGSIH